jgi:endo-1,4-beta-xylanase
MIRFSLLSALVVLLAVAHAIASPSSHELGKLVPLPATLLIDDTGNVITQLADDSRAQALDNSPSPAAPFTRFTRFHSTRSFLPVYRVQALGPNSVADVKKGDTLLAVAYLRGTTTDPNSPPVASLRLQLNGPPWTSPGGTMVSLSPEWKPVYIAGVANEDYPTGKLHLAVALGQQAQTVDLAGIVVLNLGQGVDPKSLPRTKLDWPGRSADAPWRAEAERRIRQHRMATLTLTVTDAAGNRVPNASVVLRQKTRKFEFGSFISTAYFSPDTYNNPTSVKAREIFSRLFNRATTPIYWADWGWPNQRGPYLAAARWLHENNIPTRGHVMIYPGFQFMPKSVVDLRDNPPALGAKVLAQIREIAAATSEFRFREYDVTNELRDCTDLTGILGDDAVIEWFKLARQVVPATTKLALNENSILTLCGASQANQDHYLGWYRKLKAAGVAPDVLGFQGHFSEDFTSPEKVWALLDRFAAETSADFQVTEFDIDSFDEQSQADYTRDFLTAIFAHPRVTAFTMWGFWEGDHWRPSAAMFRRDFSPKPNAKVFGELVLNKWTTNVTLTTDANGRATTTVFLGTLSVDASSGGMKGGAVVSVMTNQDSASTVQVK